MSSPRTLAPPGVGPSLGRYQVLGHLATGGMAEIYLARATGLEGFERHVVVKCIRPEHARDDRFVRMFIDEARLSAQLHHQNIAQVYDIGQQDDTYYFTMEYVHGETVRALLQRVTAARGRVPLEHALAIVCGAAAGLHYAHEKRGSDRAPLDIVHRDVSPSNIIVTYDGAVKVVDFGIAKAAVRLAETRSGTLKGKIAYMSPEQCRGEALDRRSDVFALGIVLYELTTVTRLFRGDSDYVTMNRIVTGDFTPPTAVHADYPPALEAIVLRALALDPADRHGSVAELLDELLGLGDDHPRASSAIALQRYMHDLFGEKPEPWLAPAPAIPTPTSPTAASRVSRGDTATAGPAGSGLTPGGATARASSQGAATHGSTDSLQLSAELAAPPAAGRRRAVPWLSLAIVISGALVAGALVLDPRSGSPPDDGRDAPARDDDRPAPATDTPAPDLDLDLPAEQPVAAPTQPLDAGVAARSPVAGPSDAGVAPVAAPRDRPARAITTRAGVTTRPDAGVAADAAPPSTLDAPPVAAPVDAGANRRDSAVLRPPD